jgi:integrase
VANIRKRKGVRGTKYQVQVRLAGAEPQTKTFDTREEAIAWGRSMEGQLQRHRARGTKGGHTLSEAIDRYLNEVLPQKKPSTRRTGGDLLRWWYDNHGDLRLDEITPPFLTKVRASLAAGSSRRYKSIKKLSPATVNRHLAALSHVLTVASREWEWIPDNPCRRVAKLREPQGRVRFLSREEIDRLLVACSAESPTLCAGVLLALTTGMRHGEIAGLTWADVDLGRNLIVLQDTKTGDRRGVPLASRTKAALLALPLRTGVIFLGAGGGERDPFQGPWRRVLPAAGIRDFRFHDLRHTAASYMAMNGRTEREIAELLGHRTLAMVKRYSHLSKAHVADLVDELETTLVGPRESRPRRKKA